MLLCSRELRMRAESLSKQRDQDVAQVEGKDLGKSTDTSFLLTGGKAESRYHYRV